MIVRIECIEKNKSYSVIRKVIETDDAILLRPMWTDNDKNDIRINKEIKCNNMVKYHIIKWLAFGSNDCKKITIEFEN